MRFNFCQVAINIATLSAAASISSFTATEAKENGSLADQQTPSFTPHPSTANNSYVKVQAGQGILKFCPEFVGKPKQRCVDCGGDTKVKGFCDNILLSGAVDRCPRGGCGVYCACDPSPGEDNGPPPTREVPCGVCPEVLGKPQKACSECGGSCNGVCKDMLLNGPQECCESPGCGFYCQCSEDNGAKSTIGQHTTEESTTTAGSSPTTILSITISSSAATSKNNITGLPAATRPSTKAAISLSTVAGSYHKTDSSTSVGLPAQTGSYPPGSLSSIAASSPQGGTYTATSQFPLTSQITGGSSSAPFASTGSAAPTEYLMTTTVNGTFVITATFTVTTYSQYTNLRASTTITTTQNGMETSVVVYPNGTAWKLEGVNGYTYSSGCRDYYEHGQKREAALEIREIGDIPTGNDCVDDGLHCPSWLSWFCNFHLDLSCEGWLWFLCGWKMGGTAPCGTCPPYAPPTAPPCCDNSNNNNNNNNDDNGGCSKPPKKCSNCGGANSAGLCSSGPETNCPCENDQCPSGNTQPTCSNCQGDTSNKCTSDPYKGCTCTPDECPELIDCDNCGGEEEPWNCTGIAEEGYKWKGCECYGQINETDISVYNPFTLDELLAMDALVTAMVNGSLRGHPSMNANCSYDTTMWYTLVPRVRISAQECAPDYLLEMMQQTLCNGLCEIPSGIPPQSAIFMSLPYGVCEIAIALPNNIEAYAFRTSDETFQTQDCWDSFGNITQKCIHTGANTGTAVGPNAGSVLGPDVNEYFESGFRLLNSPESVHSINGLNFGNNSALQQWCPDPPPSCNTCQGQEGHDVCLLGDAAGCSCSAAVTSPASPTSTSRTTTSAQPTPTLTQPLASCCLLLDGVVLTPLWYDVTIYANDEWVTDGGASLLNQEESCGGLLGWSAQDVSTLVDNGNWEANYAFTFTLPLIIADGCVEGGIVSAGGPPIHCFMGSVLLGDSC